MDIRRFNNIVAGHEQPNEAWFESIDPYTGQVWALIPHCAPENVDWAVESAAAAFLDPAWAGLTASARGHLLGRLADLIVEHEEQLARIESRDNGKLLTETRAQLAYIPEWYRYYGGLADKIEGRVLPIDKPTMFAFSQYEPLGVIAAILPWNSPLQLLTWKLAPLLAAGNTVVIKPSEHASASTLAFVRLFEEAGFPAGVVNTVTGFSDTVGKPLVAHPKIAKICFTGGEAGGTAVYQAAAAQLKHVTLELGGKSANIVFPDADMTDAASGVVSGIFAASGQTCIAGSRLIVHRSVHDEMVERLVALGSSAKMGDPADDSTHIAPISTLSQRAKILAHIADAKVEGAQCVLGGGVPDAPALEDGWFVEPTIFTGIDNSMGIAREEVFGPVLSMIPFDDEEEAFEIANDSPYGLAAGLWTTDIRRALEGAARIAAGTVWVNTYRTVSYLTPFGGYKRSGIGRENGQEAIFEFLQSKSVMVNFGHAPANPFIIR